MTNRHIKKCSTSQAIREMQIKAMMGYHSVPVRMAIIKKIRSNTCWQGCGEKEPLMYCWWKCKLVQPLWKTMNYLKKIKNRTTIGSRIHKYSRIFIWRKKRLIWKDNCTPILITALYMIAMIKNRWMNEKICICTHFTI